LFAIEVVPTKNVFPFRVTVPVAAGRVIVLVPAAAAGCKVRVPDVEPGIATLEIPVRARLAEPRLRATAVVPMFKVELPSTPVGIVPDRLPAVSEVRFAPDTAPKEPDQVPVVIVPTEVSEDAVTPALRVVPEILAAATPLAVVAVAAFPSILTPVKV